MKRKLKDQNSIKPKKVANPISAEEAEKILRAKLDKLFPHPNHVIQRNPGKEKLNGIEGWLFKVEAPIPNKPGESELQQWFVTETRATPQ